MRLSDENLRGRTVVAADGQALGEVSTLFLDSATWHVESIQVKLRNDAADQLGISHNIFTSGTVEVPVRLIQSVGDAVLLSVPTLELRRSPLKAAQSASDH